MFFVVVVSHHFQQLLGSQDVLLHLVCILLHAGDDLGQLTDLSPVWRHADVTLTAEPCTLLGPDWTRAQFEEQKQDISDLHHANYDQLAFSIKSRSASVHCLSVHGVKLP